MIVEEIDDEERGMDRRAGRDGRDGRDGGRGGRDGGMDELGMVRARLNEVAFAAPLL